MNLTEKQSLDDRDFYRLLDIYREGCRTSALTTYDVKTFIDRNPDYLIRPGRVLKYIIMGNACAWHSYEAACNHYETHRDSLQSLMEGIIERL